MKNVLFAIVLLILVTGCNVEKHVTRDQVDASSQTESKETVASRLDKEVKTDVLTTIDTHTSENCDTNFVTPGSNITGEKPLESLLSGSSFELENSAVKGTVLVDTITGKVSFSITEKSSTIPLRFNRTTDKRETTNKEVQENEVVKSSMEQKITAKAETESDLTVKDVKRTVPWWSFVFFAVSLVCFVFFLVRFVRNRILLK